MGHAKPLLLLTRPEAQARSFLADLETRLGFSPSTIISPILKIVPAGKPSLLDAYQTLILTSGNAVTVLGDALANHRVVTVGERTAEMARTAGADAKCIGDRIDRLISRLHEVKGPAIHLRGQHSRGDLVGAGRRAGVQIEEHVVYDQIEETLTSSAQAALKSGSVILPLFSPRSAALVTAYECHGSNTVIAMSGAVADAWKQHTEVRIADRPDRTAMLDLVAAAF